jgi:hypothetical protein
MSTRNERHEKVSVAYQPADEFPVFVDTNTKNVNHE